MSLTAGIVLVVFGTVLLLDSTGTLKLGFGCHGSHRVRRGGSHPACQRPVARGVSAMIRGMAATSGRPQRPALRDLRRDPDNGMVAGVCAGLGRRLQVDPLLLRIVFAATTLASGIGLVAYVLAWILLPAERTGEGAVRRQLSRGWGHRGTVEVALGAGFLLLSVLLAFRALGLPFSDLLIWPLTLVAAGGALIWHRSTGSCRDGRLRRPAERRADRAAGRACGHGARRVRSG